MAGMVLPTGMASGVPAVGGQIVLGWQGLALNTYANQGVINSFQLVELDVLSVPEPSIVFLLVLGGAYVMTACQTRRRSLVASTCGRQRAENNTGSVSGRQRLTARSSAMRAAS